MLLRLVTGPDRQRIVALARTIRAHLAAGRQQQSDVNNNNNNNNIDDPDQHVCDMRCYRTVAGSDPDIYVCRHTGAIHLCGDGICDSLLECRDSVSCSKTARAFPLAFVDGFPSSDEFKQHNPTQYSVQQVTRVSNVMHIADRVVQFLVDRIVPAKKRNEARVTGPFGFLSDAVRITWAGIHGSRAFQRRDVKHTYSMDYHAFVVVFELRTGLTHRAMEVLPRVDFFERHLDAGPSKIVPSFSRSGGDGTDGKGGSKRNSNNGNSNDNNNNLQIRWYTNTTKRFKLAIEAMTLDELRQMASEVGAAAHKWQIV